MYTDVRVTRTFEGAWAVGDGVVAYVVNFALKMLPPPPFYAVPPNYAVFRRFFFHPKNRVKWGDYCTIIYSNLPNPDIR